LFRALLLLLEAGADPNTLEEFSTAFRMAQKKQWRTYEGISHSSAKVLAICNKKGK
jgi:hypothetical protein